MLRDIKNWKHLIGRQFGYALELLNEYGFSIREYNPNSIITADHDDDRLNVVTDSHAKIIEIKGFG